MNLQGVHVTLHDMCLRDGMHAKQHQISLDEAARVAQALDKAGVPMIEVSHGDGLGGSSVNYGFSARSDEEYLRTVLDVVQNARISALLLPGIGTRAHLQRARELGVASIRVATHCTEADIAEQHIALGRELDMDTVGFLMMSHMLSAGELLRQAQLMESYGANCIYCTDSAGYMLPAEVREKISTLRQGLRPETELGFHGHHNLALGVANSMEAIGAGANRIDGSAAGLGAGAGNTPLEVLAAVLDRCGAVTNIDTFALADVAEDVVVPLMDQPIRLDRNSLVLGYAGVYSSFLLHAQRAEQKYGVPAEQVLRKLGEMRTVGGQEDMIEDVALNLMNSRA